MKPIPHELVEFRKLLISQLQALGETKSVPAGTAIASFDQGDSRIYLVVKGTVSIQILDFEQENEVTVTHVAPHGVFGLPDSDKSTDPRRLRISAIAKTPCTVVELQRSQLLQLASKHPDIMMEVCNGLARFTIKVVEKVGQFAFFSARGRISSALLDLCALPDAATHPSGFLIKNTRMEIAKLVGCTREMVGRVMKDLNREGMITTVGRHTIVHNSNASA